MDFLMYANILPLCESCLLPEISAAGKLLSSSWRSASPLLLCLLSLFITSDRTKRRATTFHSLFVKLLQIHQHHHFNQEMSLQKQEPALSFSRLKNDYIQEQFEAIAKYWPLLVSITCINRVKDTAHHKHCLNYRPTSSAYDYGEACEPCGCALRTVATCSHTMMYYKV